MAQISMLHIWQNHQGEPFFGQRDTQQWQYVRVVKAFHNDPLSEELVYFLEICYPC